MTDTRERLAASLEAANAKRAFYLGQADLSAAIYGGGRSGADAGGMGATLAAGGGAGH